MKKMVALLLMAVMMFSLVACAAPAAEEAPVVEEAPAEEAVVEEAPVEEEKENGKVIGMTLQTYDNPFYITMRDAVKAVTDAAGYTLIESDGQANPAKQAADIDNMIARGVDGIIICPKDSAAAAASVEKAHEAGIPIVAVDVGVTGAEVLNFVVTDNYMAGYLCGEYLVKDANGEEKTLAVNNFPSVDGCLLREQGLLAAIKDHPNIKVVATQAAGDVSGGLELGAVWLEKFPELDYIFAIHDPSGIGFKTVVETAGRQDEIKIVSVDGSDEAKAAISEGSCFVATAMQEPDTMGRRSAENLIKIIEGEQVEKEELIPVTLFTKDSAQ